MIKKLLIWGTGESARLFKQRYDEVISKYFKIIGYIDKDVKRQGTFFLDKLVYSPEEISDLDWDMILLCTLNEIYQEEMLSYLKIQGIEGQKIACYSNCNGIGLMREVFVEKYQNSHDPEIQTLIQYIDDHELTVFNNHLERSNERYKVYCDSNDDDPYIIYNDKRLYYPKEFLDIETTPFLDGVFDEQSENIT